MYTPRRAFSPSSVVGYATGFRTGGAGFHYKGDDENFVALSEAGLFKPFNDPKWHLMYKTMKNDKLDASEISTLLKRSPILVGYYEPKVNGYHMNVIVGARRGLRSGNRAHRDGPVLRDLPVQKSQLLLKVLFRDHARIFDEGACGANVRLLVTEMVRAR